MDLENRIFTQARLGRHWTEASARQCAEFFPSLYRFDAATERRFQAAHRHDYSDNLRSMLEQSEKNHPHTSS